MTRCAILEFDVIIFFDATCCTTIIVAVDDICRRIVCTTHISRDWWIRLELDGVAAAWAGTYEKIGQILAADRFFHDRNAFSPGL